MRLIVNAWFIQFCGEIVLTPFFSICYIGAQIRKTGMQKTRPSIPKFIIVCNVMAKLIDEARSKFTKWGILLKQVYDTIAMEGILIQWDRMILSPLEIRWYCADRRYLRFRPERTLRFSSPKPELDKDGKPILDKNGNPVIDMEGYKNLLTENKFRRYLQMEQFAAMVDTHTLPDSAHGRGKERTAGDDFQRSSVRVSKVYEDLLQWSVVVDTPMDAKVEKLSSLRNKLFKIKKIKNPDFDETPFNRRHQPAWGCAFICVTHVCEVCGVRNEVLCRGRKEQRVRVAADNGDPDAMAQLSIDGKNMKKHGRYRFESVAIARL